MGGWWSSLMVGGVCRQSLSVGGWFSLSVGSHRPIVGGRCSWVDGHSWVPEIVIRGWGMVVIGGGVVVRRRGVLQSRVFVIRKAAVDVEHPDGHATSAVWWWRRLLGAIAVAVSIVDVGCRCRHCHCCRHHCCQGGVSRCVVVVVSDGGGDG